MIEQLAHIAIAVERLDDAVPFYRDRLGLVLEGYEEVPTQKVRVAILKVGSTHLELLEPTADDSPISKFLKTRGPGLHHMAFTTRNLAERLQELDQQGVALLDHAPRPGASGTEVAFLHPKASGGVLIELCAPAQPGVLP